MDIHDQNNLSYLQLYSWIFMIEMICLIYHNILMNIHGKIICLITIILLNIHDRNDLSSYKILYTCSHKYSWSKWIVLFITIYLWIFMLINLLSFYWLISTTFPTGKGISYLEILNLYLRICKFSEVPPQVIFSSPISYA